MITHKQKECANVIDFPAVMQTFVSMAIFIYTFQPEKDKQARYNFKLNSEAINLLTS